MKEITINTSFCIPAELNYLEDTIKQDLTSTFKDEVKRYIDRRLSWYNSDQKILKCPHKFVTKNERTSAYDSEDVTECSLCGTSIEYYVELLKSNKK